MGHATSERDVRPQVIIGGVTVALDGTAKAFEEGLKNDN
jgi:hypothetical protein